ncbi:cysteine hydrolase [Rhizobium sp. WSM4643]|uniref:cysteine hydrolase family protein n=1 Tax=Rhizobium sp. WSM4643 TaxID=3138253 RepID=UPI0021A6A308|nr:cysteine hydrolase [Rhizobium leguminosarum]UWM73679.1 cysteine hydrolase [Rhizobium leguminosarum bv. viciae]
MHSIEHPGKTIGDFCRPDQMALVVYDMQIGIMRQMPDGAGITTRVLSVLTAARASNFPVIFMRHMSMPLALMGAFQRRQAMAWQRIDDPAAIKPWFLRGSEGFEIVPELQPRYDEAVIDKITFSAFEGTPLSIILRDLGLTSFAICGVATEIGIEPTVRHGADLGLVPLVISDACGAGHAEAAERSFANMAFMGDALICQSADFIAAARQS